MSQSLDKRYYTKDLRSKAALLASVPLIGAALVPVAIVIGFYNHQIALIVFLFGLLIFWKFGDLSQSILQRDIEFSGSKAIDTPILFGELSSPDQAEKLHLLSENVGGLFREEDEIVLGSMFGEFRCPIEDFSYSITEKNFIIGYLNLKIGKHEISFSPTWSGHVEKALTNSDKAVWGGLIIDKILGKTEPLTNILTKSTIDTNEKMIEVEILTDNNSISVLELVIRDKQVCDYDDDSPGWK